MQKGLPAREAPFAVWQGAARQAGDPSAALRFVRLRFRARGRCAPYADAFALCVLQIALARSETLVFALARDPSAALRSAQDDGKRALLPEDGKGRKERFAQEDGGGRFFRMTERQASSG